MSLKNDIEMVKEELNSEEKFFEKAVITERFVKKYKKPIIGAFVAVVVFAGANIAYDLKEQNRISSANNALLKLQNNSKDTKSLEELKSLAPELYDVWLYSKAVAENDVKTLEKLTASSALVIGDLSSYEVAQNTQDVKKLDSYALKQGAIYKDLAIIQSAIVLMGKNDIKQAHEKLSEISQKSALGKIATALLHYGVK